MQQLDSALSPTITVEEAARWMGVSRAAAYQGVRNGSIPSLRVGRRVVVPTATLLKMLGLEDRLPEVSAS